MRNTILLSLLLLCTYVQGQIFAEEDTITKHAIIIGISDYQNEDIPDLEFADQDAQAFADFLLSPAGGNLDSANVNIFVNEAATAATISLELFRLLRTTKEGDEVYIYFSGHGDVEKEIMGQPGHLLCWDATPNVYILGGTIELSYFQRIISTLTSSNKAQVILITDACRAGKLAGSDVNGSQLTNANLKEQQDNEIKILSCRSNEYSVEGTQWGGGHGAFSYHLIEGLYGLADSDEDYAITLDEVFFHLRQNVTPQVKPKKQYPETVGDPERILFRINPDSLEAFKTRKEQQLLAFGATNTKGLDNSPRSLLNPSNQTVYDAFKKAIEEQRFLSPKANCAEYYYQQLMAIAHHEEVHPRLQSTYAAALLDEVQQVLNNTLKTDLSEIALSRSSQKVKYAAYPAYLQRASEILGSDHYMQATILSRKDYFEAYLGALENQNKNKELGNQLIEKYKSALQYKGFLPHVYLGMSNVFTYNLEQPDSAEHYARLAAEAAPTWILPYTNLAYSLSTKYRQYDKAKSYLETASQIDSTNTLVLNAWGNWHYFQKDYDTAKAFYIKCLAQDPDFICAHNNLGSIEHSKRVYFRAVNHYDRVIEMDSTFVEAHVNRSLSLLSLRRFIEAEQGFKKAIALEPDFLNAYSGLGIVYINSGILEAAEEILQKALVIDPDYSNAHQHLAKIYTLQGRWNKATQHLKKGLAIQADNFRMHYALGDVYFAEANYADAETHYTRGAELDPNITLSVQNKIGEIYYQTNRYEEAELWFTRRVIPLLSNDPEAYYQMARMRAMQNKKQASYNWLVKALERGFDDRDRIVKDEKFQAIVSSDKFQRLLDQHFIDQ